MHGMNLELTGPRIVEGWPEFYFMQAPSAAQISPTSSFLAITPSTLFFAGPRHYHYQVCKPTINK
jgi:hypothetical protein